MKKIIFSLLSIIFISFVSVYAEEDFVQASGSQFVIGSEPFYFSGANNDYLYHSSQFMIDDLLNDARDMDLTVVRTWGSSEGQESLAKYGFCFQPNPGEYDEATFQNLDYIIAKAKENNLRLIIPLVNNWDNGFGGMQQYVRWCLGDVKDWSAKSTLTFDLYNAGDATLLDVAVSTGTDWVWHESQFVNINSGWNYNLSFDLTSSNWKAESSGWSYTVPIADLDKVQRLDIGVFGYSVQGQVYIDNIRLDGQLYDGLEFLDNWSAGSSHSDATAVSLASAPYKSEGKHSLKLTYGANVFGKAFAEKIIQANKDEFYTNPGCKQLYKDYISFILNRINTITGIAYKNEPTIMMWELANEPRCPSDPTGSTLQDWTDEIAGFIKSIDTNHLVSTGSEGFYNNEGTTDWKYNGSIGVDYIPNHQSTYIDACSFHLYPENYGTTDSENIQWIQEHIDDAHINIGKPVYMGEFGRTADRKATILHSFDTDDEGWSIDWGYTQGPFQVETPTRDGNGAIYYDVALSTSTPNAGGRIIYPGEGINYSNYDYLSGWVYVPVSAPDDLYAEMYAQVGSAWSWVDGDNVTLIPGEWNLVTLTKQQVELAGYDLANVRGLGIQVRKNIGDYNGRVYYDLIGGNLIDVYEADAQIQERNRLYSDWYDALDTNDADGACLWQLDAHQDDGSLYPDVSTLAVYYPEDADTSNIIKQFSMLMKEKSGTSITDTAPPSITNGPWVGWGNWDKLLVDYPFLKKDELIYWTQADNDSGIDQVNSYWQYRQLPTGSLQVLLVDYVSFWGADWGFINPFPASGLAEGQYELIYHIQDNAGNYIDNTSNPYALTIDRTQPQVSGLWKGWFQQVDGTILSEDTLLYFVHIEDGSGIDETNSNWTYTGPTNGTLTITYFNWWNARWGKFTFPASTLTSGTYTITGNVLDKAGNTTQVTYTVDVGTVNNPPVLDPIGDKTFNEKQALSFGVLANDEDNDPITLTADMPQALIDDGAVFNDWGGGFGVFNWTPSTGMAGTYQVTFTASDGQLQDEETINIIVEP